MTTASQTASAIRANLKDFNDFGGAGLAPLVVSYIKGSMTDAKLLSIDSINRKNQHSITTSTTDPVSGNKTTTTTTTPYTLPTQTISLENAASVMEAKINAAVAGVATAGATFATDPSTLVSLEIAAEKLEFATQLWSGFKGLSNVKLNKVTAAGEDDYSYILSGEIGSGVDLCTVYAETIVVV
ncbi:MAG: hypothetical protein VKL42_12515 [Snowella sp.]|nr:hypothetical protein [Snowella sp.]